MLQAPSSFLAQKGPPGCTSSTSMPRPRRRYIRMPALRSGMTLPGSALLLRLDLLELRPRPLELVVEQPHRIHDLAKRRRRPGTIRLAEGEDRVVAQVAHDG